MNVATGASFAPTVNVNVSLLDAQSLSVAVIIKVYVHATVLLPLNNHVVELNVTHKGSVSSHDRVYPVTESPLVNVT